MLEAWASFPLCKCGGGSCLWQWEVRQEEVEAEGQDDHQLYKNSRQALATCDPFPKIIISSMIGI